MKFRNAPRSCLRASVVNSRHPAAFTLVEVLVAVGIIAILFALVVAVLPGLQLRSQRTASLSNLRQIGVALQAFANENNNLLPGRVQTSDKWPRLLIPYLSDSPKIYGTPGDKSSFLYTGADPLANNRNHTSFILNGCNDVGAFDDEAVRVNLLSIERPTETILMGIQSGSGNFYMDFNEGNHLTVLNLTMYGNGSNYLFADGSSRFLDQNSYTHTLWLIDKSAAIP